MVTSRVPAWVTLISLLAAEHDVSSVASPVSNSSYYVTCKRTPLTERLTDLLSAQEYYTIYHQAKVAKGHTNKLHEKSREVIRNKNVHLFHFFYSVLHKVSVLYDTIFYLFTFLF